MITCNEFNEVKDTTGRLSPGISSGLAFSSALMKMKYEFH